MKNFLANLGVLAGSAAFTVITLEILFPRFLHKLPLETHVALDEGLRILAQTSKNSVIPKNYVALMGDSYAQGIGDWLTSELKKNKPLASPDYHSAHILYRSIGQDIITFGAGGSGSLRGLVAEPITQFLYINSMWAFELEKPDRILVYFYEGNDLADNITDLNERFNPTYDESQFYDPEYFKKFITQTVLEKDPLYNTEAPLKNYIFTRFLWKGVENGGTEILRGIRKLKKFASKLTENKPSIKAKDNKADRELPPPSKTKPQRNTVLLNGKESIIPHRLPAGPVDMTDEKIEKAEYVFQQALLYMAEFFSEIPIGIVYIPSPASSYKLISPVTVKNYIDLGFDADSVDAEFINQRSQEICRRVEKFAQVNQFAFLDTRKFLRKTAAREFIHGPRDWGHLNKKGYHVLSDAIQTAFFNDKGESAAFGCDR